MTILVVDDNHDNMKQVVDEFRLDGHEAIHVHDRPELLSVIDKYNFDGIILDLMFPPVNSIPPDKTEYGYTGGVFLYEEDIKKKLKNVPFVVLTAMDESTKLFLQVKEKITKYPSFRGIFFKIYFNNDDIIKALSK